MKNRLPLLLLLLLLQVACDTIDPKTEVATDNKKEFVKNVNYVDTMHIRRSPFHMELISNGKLRALQKSDLKFAGSGMVTTLNVINGATVEKGAVIASLDRRELQLRYDQAIQKMERANIDLHDALLGFGYTSTDTTLVKAEHLKIAKIRSGYNSALSDISSAEMAMENSVLVAPFRGKIANLQTKLHETPKGDFFCSVINDSSFDVEFAVLESELINVHLGQPIQVATFTDPLKKHHGTVKGINPMVDEKGQIMVTANIPNPGGLIDGMNIKAYVENIVQDKLVVPKSAVLIRDNLEVLFRVSPEGKALWTYVYITAANSNSYAVVANEDRGADLSPGDVVITGGNLNLANDVPVEVKK